MARMVKKQVYIQPQQVEGLKRLSRRLGVSESDLIRKGVALVLSETPEEEDIEGGWQRDIEKMHTSQLLKLLSEDGESRPPLSEDDESRAGWDTMMSRARSGYYRRLFGEKVWDRESIYAERLDRLLG